MARNNKKMWAYIAGSIALIGASFLLRKKAMKMMHHSETGEGMSQMP
jgi:hypothetical protein